MSKTIKIIDLINKIANGEELPEKIKYKDIIYNWKVTKQGTGYCNKNKYYYEWLANRIHCDEKSVLNDTVEIIEEQEEIDIQSIKNLEYVEDYEADKTDIRLNRDKINELVQAVKQLDKKIKEER